jgi:hypothetical protein
MALTFFIFEPLATSDAWNLHHYITFTTHDFSLGINDAISSVLSNDWEVVTF